MSHLPNHYPAKPSRLRLSKRQSDMFQFTLMAAGFYHQNWRFNPKNGLITPPGKIGADGKWRSTEGGFGAQMKRLQEKLWEEFVLWGIADQEFRETFQEMPGYEEAVDRLGVQWAKTKTKKADIYEEIEKRRWIKERTWIGYGKAKPESDDVQDLLRPRGPKTSQSAKAKAKKVEPVEEDNDARRDLKEINDAMSMHGLELFSAVEAEEDEEEIEDVEEAPKEDPDALREKRRLQAEEERKASREKERNATLETVTLHSGEWAANGIIEEIQFEEENRGKDSEGNDWIARMAVVPITYQTASGERETFTLRRMVMNWLEEGYTGELDWKLQETLPVWQQVNYSTTINLVRMLLNATGRDKFDPDMLHGREVGFVVRESRKGQEIVQFVKPSKGENLRIAA